MNVVYHAVPPSLVGNTLYPLNQLKDVDRDAYEQAVKKYEGREELMKCRIGRLGCLWNDVIFTLPVHPRLADEALRARGRWLKSRSWYEIDASLLDPDRTIIFTHEGGKRKRYLPFSPEAVSRYVALPEKTLAYYDREIAPGKTIILFAYVPHVMYRGTLDVGDLKVIEL